MAKTMKDVEVGGADHNDQHGRDAPPTQNLHPPPNQSTAPNQPLVGTPILLRPTFSISLAVNVVLRILAFIFTLIAFSVTASDGKGVMEIGSMKYLVAINVMAMVYSLVQTIASCSTMLVGSQVPKPVGKLVCFIGDELMAFLLMSCSSAAANDIRDWVDIVAAATTYLTTITCSDIPGCSQAAAGVTMSTLAFPLLLASSIRSGYYLFNACSSSKKY